jgi:hypothetical protein
VTETGPVLPPTGAVTTRVVDVALLTAAVVPLNFTLSLAEVTSKCVPVIVTEVPAVPEMGLIDAIVGAGGGGGGGLPPPFFLHATKKIVRVDSKAKPGSVFIR